MTRSTKDSTTKKAGNNGTPAKDELDRPIPLPPPPGKVVVYYDRGKGGFYTRDQAGSYQRTERDLLSLELRRNGFHRKALSDFHLSPLEDEVLRISKEQGVDYAGPLGGYPVGVHPMFSGRILVTSGPTFVVAKEGRWDNLRAFLEQLLGDQQRYFFGWMKWALVALRGRAPWPPGQAFAMAGPVGCGKSFLQSLITPMLGNRASKPYKYLIGKSEFNGEIFAAEHGIIGDEVPLLDIRSRRNFGSSLKNLIVNKEQALRGMYKEAVTLTPFLRISISLNDDPESLLALPPLDSDVKDKLIIVKATPVEFPWPSKEFADSKAFYAKLVGELPAFVHWLYRWKVPDSIRCQRYGIESFHNPDLVKSVDDMAPEWKLWELIVHHLGATKTPATFVGSSLDLERKLKTADKTGEVGKLLAWNTACGQYLGKLAVKLPSNINIADGGARKRVFTIEIPANERSDF